MDLSRAFGDCQYASRSGIGCAVPVSIVRGAEEAIE